MLVHRQHSVTDYCTYMCVTTGTLQQARIKLESQFRPRYAELYSERTAIVSGAKEVPDVPEIEAAAVAAAAAENNPDAAAAEEEEIINGIPQFWLQSLMRHEAIAVSSRLTSTQCATQLVTIL
jgi:Nucleosome assembly protein (NAP)